MMAAKNNFVSSMTQMDILYVSMKSVFFYAWLIICAIEKHRLTLGFPTGVGQGKSSYNMKINVWKMNIV